VSSIVYNQEYLSPTKKNLSGYLRNYIPYIASESKSKIINNIGQSHCLFGCIKGNHDTKDINDLSDTVKYVVNKSQKDRCIIYHGFFSLSAEEVSSQGYEERYKWEEFFSNSMNDVAKTNKIKLDNFEWISAMHIRKNQTHCHFLFWDKNQDIKNAFVPPKIYKQRMEKIRKGFAKTVYQDEFNKFYKKKDEAFSELKKGISPFLDSFDNIIKELNEDELNKLEKKLESISSDNASYDSFDPYITDWQLAKVVKEIMHIVDIVPDKGALKYEYMPSEIKDEINEAVKRIINSNKNCSNSFHKYIKTAEDICKIYSDKPDSLDEAKTQAEGNVYKSVGNILLKAVKELNSIKKKMERKSSQKV
jgi:hypothetical protein